MFDPFGRLDGRAIGSAVSDMSRMSAQLPVDARMSKTQASFVKTTASER